VNFVKPIAYYTLTSIDARLRDKIHRRAETPRSSSSHWSHIKCDLGPVGLI